MSAKASATAAKAPRARLTREAIAAAGLDIARREPLSDITIKSVATRLGVTPMAIYRHFKDKAALIDAVLDRFVREADVNNHGIDPADWKAWLRATHIAMYRALVDVPSVIPYLSTASRFGPNAMASLERTLSVLRGAGLSNKAAAETAGALTALVIGYAIMDTAFFRALSELGPNEPQELKRRVGMLLAAQAQDRYPSVVHLSRQLATVMLNPALESGLSVMLDAVEARRRA